MITDDYQGLPKGRVRPGEGILSVERVGQMMGSYGRLVFSEVARVRMSLTPYLAAAAIASSPQGIRIKTGSSSPRNCAW